MILNGSYKFKKAIIVNRDVLEEIERIILEHYSKISYSAKLVNEYSITFDSLNELTDYENYGNNKISTLTINSGYDLTLYFMKSSSMLHNYDSTVLCEYKINSDETAIILENKLKKALEPHKQSFVYTIMSKISAMYWLIFSIIMLLSVLIVYIVISKETDNASPTVEEKAFAIIFGFAIMAIVLILQRMRDYLFQPIIFYWKSEIKRYEKLCELRKNIFWGVIVASLLTVVLSLIL